MEYCDWNDLKKSLVNIFQDVLNEEVTKNLKSTLLDIINKNVYSKYTPIYYKRRMGSGGLKSKRQMISTNKQTATIARIFFTTQAKGNPDKYFVEKEGFLKRIEYGNKNPYFGSTSDPYNRPRPFMSTLKSRSVNTLIIKPLRNGLEGKGIKTFK